MISSDLLAAMLQFRRKRNWEQFHTPKNLAISLSVEAAELLEIFQWKTNDEIVALLASDSKQLVQDEVADVAIMLSYLCHDLDIDLNVAVRSKLEKNEVKYPVEKAFGNSRKYSEC